MIIDALTTAVNNRFYPAAIRKMLASIIEAVQFTYRPLSGAG